MTILTRSWRFNSGNQVLTEQLSRDLKISPIIAQLLINRGITDQASAIDFLYGGPEQLEDPYHMKDMAKAVERIVIAIESKQPVVIYGDYDVDGITASAVLYKVLTRLGADVKYYIPERQSEGYGLNDAALAALLQSEVKLVITVDCGISAVSEVQKVRDKLDIIITDHHQPPEVLPPAYAIINPKQADCQYKDKNLAGVGVAFKLCQALWKKVFELEQPFLEYLDLFAIGTIADMVPLTGENRILTKMGLEELSNTSNIGLQALLEVTGLTNCLIDAGKVGFVIAPRLNAAGRLRHATAAVELLFTTDRDRANCLAQLLDEENRLRQTVEKEILQEAERALADYDWDNTKVIVLASEDWHPGVIGIVASRLVEKYYRPAIMISVREGMGKGSCRSIPGFDMYQALRHCEDLLIQFGGHRQAAGLVIPADNIANFTERLNMFAANNLTANDYVPTLYIDSLVRLEEINVVFLKQLSCLSPHGMGNPSPIFACEKMSVTDFRVIGREGRHLKMRVEQYRATGEVVAWHKGELAARLNRYDIIDLAFQPELNEWRGKQTIQLRMCDLRKSAAYSLESMEFKDQHIVVRDARRMVDRLKYVADIVESGEQTLIFVSADQSRKALAKSFGLRGMACYFGADEERNKKILQLFKDGKVKTLLTAYTGAELFTCHISNIIVYDLPANARNFARLLNYCYAYKQQLTVHLLYCSNDVNNSFRMINSLALERRVIGYVYLIIKEYSLKQNKCTLTDRNIADKIWKKYCARIDETSVAIILKILKDLNLILEESSGERLLYLAPQPARKLRLEESPTFQEGKLAHESFRAYIDKALTYPSWELWSWIRNNLQESC